MSRLVLRLVAALGLAGLAVLGAAVLYLQDKGITPRALAPYMEKRAEGHNALIVETGRRLGAVLRWLDRGELEPYALPALTVGAQATMQGRSGGRTVLVGSVDEARRAFAAARPGDAITFLPGRYRIKGSVRLYQSGAAGMPVVVRADRPGSVVLELDSGEGFVVGAPYWTFENLDIRGSCARPEWCQHAFHVVGKGTHFVARNNTITDFNAHFKINGDSQGYPDHGLIEANTLTNTTPRPTRSPVTPIDIVTANDWTIRANLITDFIKAEGDRISYGAFAKGAAARNVFERNVIICEQKLRGLAGQRVGLSFGGGGTGKQYCRDGKCITEHDGGTMRANLIVACSDAGIYLNSSAGTRLLDNTLIDTAGVQVRYPESSAELDGNIIDGPVTSRDGAVLRLGDNRSTPVAALYAGLHPQRSLFVGSAVLDLRWEGEPPRRSAPGPSLDLCGTQRPAARAYGAFENFAGCRAAE